MWVCVNSPMTLSWSCYTQFRYIPFYYEHYQPLVIAINNNRSHEENTTALVVVCSLYAYT